MALKIHKYDRTGKLGEMQPCDADQFLSQNSVTLSVWGAGLLELEKMVGL